MHFRKLLPLGITIILVLYVGMWVKLAKRSGLLPDITWGPFTSNTEHTAATPERQQPNKEITPPDTTVSPDTAAPSEPVATPSANPYRKTFDRFTEEDIRKGQVAWQAPEDLGDLGWTSPEIYKGTYRSDLGYSSGVRYVKVGSVTSGQYAGADILVVLSWFYGDFPRSDAPDIGHYLRLPQRVVWLPYAATPNGLEVEAKPETTAEAMSEGEDRQLALRAPDLVLDAETRIEELSIYPKEFSGRNAREVFEQEPYAPRAFLSELALKTVFSHSELGQVWMAGGDAAQPQNALNAYAKHVYESEKANRLKITKEFFDPVEKGGFYVRRPDGISETYRLKLDIFDRSDRTGLLQATWNDGTRNTYEYEEYPSGCGVEGYAYDATAAVSIERDLVPAGKTDTGDPLYVFKDPSVEEMRNFFQTAKDGSADATLKITNEQDFVASRPIVFWVDPFGRTLKFYNAAILPLAECGKPVVYLYPERAMDVSVRVYPSEGVSVSDPPYHDGWDVVADPNGELFNKADGRKYSSLFWEGGSSNIYHMPETGFVTSKEKLDKFFDEKLSQLGLSDREAADFKAFWIPKMRESEKPYYFVTFLSRQHIDELAPLVIIPRPDTFIRVMMDYEGLETWKEVPGFRIRRPERRGFTAVEWGGRLRP